MVDIDLLEQLVHAMEDAVVKLEGAFQKGDLNYINKLRIFIFNVYQQIDKTLMGPSSGASKGVGARGSQSTVASSSNLGGKNV